MSNVARHSEFLNGAIYKKGILIGLYSQLIMNYEEKITLDVLQSQAMFLRVCHISEESGYFLMQSLYLFQKYVLFKD